MGGFNSSSILPTPIKQAANQVYGSARAQANAVGAPPPPGPDLTDEAVKQARRNQLALLMAARGRAGSFAAGPLGDTSAPSIGRPSVLGGT